MRSPLARIDQENSTLSEMNKKFNILLGPKCIGTTDLEHSDLSMGVVFGTIIPCDKSINFDYFSNYCKLNGISVDVAPEVRLINTRTIMDLRIQNMRGEEIGNGLCCISGMDSEGYTITIEGMSSEIIEKEFPKIN